MRNSEQLTIAGFSTALFSTWYFCAEMGILFDCGDGASTCLLQKAGKVRHIFISHADRDHLAGLLQFLQLNGRPRLSIYYPKDCGSFPALADFSAKFDPHTAATQWIPIEPGFEVRVREDLAVRAIANRHVESKPGVKSLSYVVESISRKLKAELVGKNGSEIAMLKKQHGEEAVSDIKRSTKLIYSGDTPIETDGRYRDAEVLIHEATFLTSNEIESDNPKRNKHSSLDQVVEMVAASDVRHLILGHFSSRYSYEQIDEAIKQECERVDLKIPVYRVLPGMIGRDILRQLKIDR